jgi:hypothetical protein
VFRQQSDAIPYTPKAGDTFHSIVDSQCDESADPKITCDEIALYNWGTAKPNEVARALVELLGVRKWNDDDPYKWELDPARGIGKNVLMPKLIKKEGLAYEKDHKLKVKQQLPATAVQITKLDKWFLPAEETCDTSWELEGVKASATKLDFDVYASNYCKASPTNDHDFFTFTFTAAPDVPIRQKSVTRSSWITLSPTIWPWSGHRQYGIVEASAANLEAFQGLADLKQRIWDPLWWKYTTRISLEMVKQIEKQKGRMRGHVVWNSRQRLTPITAATSASGAWTCSRTCKTRPVQS